MTDAGGEERMTAYEVIIYVHVEATDESDAQVQAVEQLLGTNPDQWGFGEVTEEPS